MNQVQLCGYLLNDFKRVRNNKKIFIIKNILVVYEECAYTGIIKEAYVPITLYENKAREALKHFSKGKAFLGTGKITTSIVPSKYTNEKIYLWNVAINHFEFPNTIPFKEKDENIEEVIQNTFEEEFAIDDDINYETMSDETFEKVISHPFKKIYQNETQFKG